ncbi:MAG TPA: hypothetical protein VK249_10460 [Anaerolineales bacterium]|nr:hypothetical protein [Anaerolineales bacterium]
MTLVDLFYFVFFFIFYLSVPFWIPAAIGLYLLTSRQTALGRMAGFLTLKPIIATPIWAMIISFLHHSGTEAQHIALWSILPGAGLTVLVIVIFRRLFLGSRLILAMLLIMLDCARWINSGLLTLTVSLPYNAANNTWAGIFAFIGLIFPTAYSVVALTTALATREN